MSTSVLDEVLHFPEHLYSQMSALKRSRTVCILHNSFRKKALEEFSNICIHRDCGYDEWYIIKGVTVIHGPILNAT
jgi:hypothetical protein